MDCDGDTVGLLLGPFDGRINGAILGNVVGGTVGFVLGHSTDNGDTDGVAFDIVGEIVSVTVGTGTTLPDFKVGTTDGDNVVVIEGALDIVGVTGDVDPTPLKSSSAGL
jgi:hypothetical protein